MTRDGCQCAAERCHNRGLSTVKNTVEYVSEMHATDTNAGCVVLCSGFDGCFVVVRSVLIVHCELCIMQGV